jgi:hypothetical protein
MFTGNGAHPPARSQRAALIARWFGLDRCRLPQASCDQAERAREIAALIVPGTIALLSGASGSGKTTLLAQLRRLAEQDGRTWIDIAEISLPKRPVVDCFDETATLGQVLGCLSRVGLGEAATYLRTPSELSDGQRWRLRMAMAMHHVQGAAAGKTVIVADEFAATLDRISAMVVARALRRSIDASSACGPAAIVATSHTDLLDALGPDVVANCDFGRVHITRRAAV